MVDGAGQVIVPNQNPNLADFMKDVAAAHRLLRVTVQEALSAFYKCVTGLPMPSSNVHVRRDVRRWREQRRDGERHTATPGDDGNVSESELLHFSLLDVPPYAPFEFETESYPQALDAFVTSARESTLASCVFFEDDCTCVVYARCPKSVVHLIVVPKSIVSGPGDLDPRDPDDVAMLEGMVARGQWMMDGLATRDELPDHYKMGFHAIPALGQLHMHVMSTDVATLQMNSVAHYHSFTTCALRFVPARIAHGQGVLCAGAPPPQANRRGAPCIHG